MFPTATVVMERQARRIVCMMGVLNADMQRLVEAELGFVATVCPDGTPNLSPKGTIAVWDDDHLVFADLRSPGTVENLRSNPSIEVNVVDQLARKGYRLKGTGTVHTDGEVFERGVAFYDARGTVNARERIRGIVIVTVERALPVHRPRTTSAPPRTSCASATSAGWCPAVRARGRTSNCAGERAPLSASSRGSRRRCRVVVSGCRNASRATVSSCQRVGTTSATWSCHQLVATTAKYGARVPAGAAEQHDRELRLAHELEVGEGADAIGRGPRGRRAPVSTAARYASEPWTASENQNGRPRARRVSWYA